MPVKEINKRVLDARYVDWLLKFEDSLGRVANVIDIMKANLSIYMSEGDIKKIIDIEEVESKLRACEVSTMMDYLIRTLKSICSDEGKTYGEISDYMENMIAKEYGVSKNNVNIYTSIQSQLQTLQRVGLVAVDDYEGNKKLYKYIGQ